MNLYFLSLLEKERKRVKNLCTQVQMQTYTRGLITISQWEFERKELRKRYNLNKEDMVLQGKNFIGFIQPDTSIFKISDHGFHPLHFPDVKIHRYLSRVILERVKKSKVTYPVPSSVFLNEIEFSGFRVGKNRFTLRCIKPTGFPEQETLREEMLRLIHVSIDTLSPFEVYTKPNSNKLHYIISVFA
jgi:hypothetical protein